MEILGKSTTLTGRNIWFDWLYTSVPLAEWLLAKKIACIGTLQHNKKDIPIEIKKVKTRDLLSSEIYLEKSKNVMTFTSNTFQTFRGKKNGLLLATHSPILGITKDYDRRNYVLTNIPIVDTKLISLHILV